MARLVEQTLEEGYLRLAAGDRVTFGQLNILKFLARPGTFFIKDVARFLNASEAAASKAVDRLEARGWVTHRPHGADRRAEVLHVTARGRALIRRYEKLKSDRVRALLEGEDLEALSGGLERAIAVLMRERGAIGNPCLGCGAYYSPNCIVRALGHYCPCHREIAPAALRRPPEKSGPPAGSARPSPTPLPPPGRPDRSGKPR